MFNKIKVRVAGMIFIMHLCGFGCSIASAQNIPAFEPIPYWVEPQVKDKLTGELAELKSNISAFQAQGEAFNAKPAEQQTDAELQLLESQKDSIVKNVNSYNQEVDKYWGDSKIVIDSMLNQSDDLGWSKEKRAHLEQVLRDLGPKINQDEYSVSENNIYTIWRNVKNRDLNALKAIKEDAVQGQGPTLNAAGQQIKYADCAIFALAAATGVPYGVIAARACSVISGDKLRSDKERLDPEATVKKSGLNGGEVIMVAEAMGQAEAIPITDFAQALSNGRPVLINVDHGTFEHEVVLSRAFQHDGTTWFEMMDSKEGLKKRLYLSQDQLSHVILEKGVAFSPAPGTVVKPIP